MIYIYLSKQTSDKKSDRYQPLIIKQKLLISKVINACDPRRN